MKNVLDATPPRHHTAMHPGLGRILEADSLPAAREAFVVLTARIVQKHPLPVQPHL